MVLKKVGMLVPLSFNELLILCNSFNEICHGFRVSNFERKIGASKEQACAILKRIGAIYDGRTLGRVYSEHESLDDLYFEEGIFAQELQISVTVMKEVCCYLEDDDELQTRTGLNRDEFKSLIEKFEEYLKVVSNLTCVEVTVQEDVGPPPVELEFSEISIFTILKELAEEKTSRERASYNANRWITGRDFSENPVKVCRAVGRLSGADMISVNNAYLYSSYDFHRWLQEFLEPL